MRAVLLVLILGIVAVIVAVASGLVSIGQIRGAKAPDVSATNNGVTAAGGQAPAFEIETGSVKVGTRETKVRVPAVAIEPAQNGTAVQNQAAPATNGM